MDGMGYESLHIVALQPMYLDDKDYICMKCLFFFSIAQWFSVNSSRRLLCRQLDATVIARIFSKHATFPTSLGSFQEIVGVASIATVPSSICRS